MDNCLVSILCITKSSRIADSAVFLLLQYGISKEFMTINLVSKQTTLENILPEYFLLCSCGFMKGYIDAVQLMKNGKLSLVAFSRTPGLFKISDLHFPTKYCSRGIFQWGEDVREDYIVNESYYQNPRFYVANSGQPDFFYTIIKEWMSM